LRPRNPIGWFVYPAGVGHGWQVPGRALPSDSGQVAFDPDRFRWSTAPGDRRETPGQRRRVRARRPAMRPSANAAAGSPRMAPAGWPERSPGRPAAAGLSRDSGPGTRRPASRRATRTATPATATSPAPTIAAATAAPYAVISWM